LGPGDHGPSRGIEAYAELHLDLLGLPSKVPQLDQCGIRDRPGLLQCAFEALARLNHDVIDPCGPLDTGLVIGYLYEDRSAGSLKLQQLLH
jgi:hypothetical protein